MTKQLADQLERLMVAETESSFYNCVTDNIDSILVALRAPSKSVVREQVIKTCVNIASRHRPNLTARDIEQEIRRLSHQAPRSSSGKLD